MPPWLSKAFAPLGPGLGGHRLQGRRVFGSCGPHGEEPGPRRLPGPEQEAVLQEQNRFPSSARISHPSNEDLFWVSPARFPCRVVESWSLNPAGGPRQRSGRGCCGEEGRSSFWGARAEILEEEGEGGGRCPRTSTRLGHGDDFLWDLFGGPSRGSTGLVPLRS